MEVNDKQVFNLWDTNGRRNDVLNALSIYIDILKELEEESPEEKWASYPESLLQYKFYVKALARSPEILKKHDKYDEFIELISDHNEAFLMKKEEWFTDKSNDKILKLLDEAIEARARHYTSNLVRIGFATDKRKVTPAGIAFYKNSITRDTFEKLLPVNDTNILFLRQLMKLKIFSKTNGDKRVCYSPFYMALYLLLANKNVDKKSFIFIIQGANPYLDESKRLFLLNDEISMKEKTEMLLDIDVEIKEEFTKKTKVDKDLFCGLIKNGKSSKTELLYYDFYSALYDFHNEPDLKNFERLRNSYLSNKDKIKKAFCLGDNVFDFGIKGNYDFDKFKEKNEENVFLKCEKINETFYIMYEKSKYIDTLYEYSDTTMRMLGATGLIQTKTLIQLLFKNVLKEIFPIEKVKERIFGEFSELSYLEYEVNEDSIFGNIQTIIEIFGIDDRTVESDKQRLKSIYNVDNDSELCKILDDEINDNFRKFLEINYPIEKVSEILKLFSNRKNDKTIKDMVSKSADVPTIYEYIVGIAWYYISNKNFNLHDCYNLTMNADFEPECHANGGQGDLVIDYEDKTIMVEMTLMNKAAQKRGEWEPVLRHSINNKVEKSPKEAYTFFVADDLDYNTINIWRAVAAVPLESTNGNRDKVTGVIIMPFNNSEIIYFLNNNISSDKIVEEVTKSYSVIPHITNDSWRTEVLNNLK